MTASQITMEALSVLERASRDMLAAMMEDQERTRYFYLGYTREEERQWLLLNRCCHPGQAIRVKARPVMMRVGKLTVALRRAQPSPPPRV